MGLAEANASFGGNRGSSTTAEGAFRGEATEDRDSGVCVLPEIARLVETNQFPGVLCLVRGL